MTFKNEGERPPPPQKKRGVPVLALPDVIVHQITDTLTKLKTLIDSCQELLRFEM